MTEQQVLLTNTNESSNQNCYIDMGNETKLLSDFDFVAISSYVVYDENGNKHTIADLSSEFKTIFVFVRVISFLIFNSAWFLNG